MKVWQYLWQNVTLLLKCDLQEFGNTYAKTMSVYVEMLILILKIFHFIKHFIVISDMDASEIRACVNVTVDGIEGPLYSGCANGGCAKLKQYFPQYAKFCPLHKGSKLGKKCFQVKFL